MNLTRQAGILLGTLVLAAPSFSQDEEKQKHLLRYAFEEGSSGYYAFAQDMVMNMSMGEQQMNTAVKSITDVHWKVLELDGKSAKIEQTFQRIRVSMDNPMMGKIDYDSAGEGRTPPMLTQLADLVGSKVTARVSPRGAVSDMELPDVAGGQLGLEKMFDQFLPLLPEEPVAVGERWEVDLGLPMQQLGEVETAFHNELLAVDGREFTLGVEIEMKGNAPQGKVELKEAKGKLIYSFENFLPVEGDMKMRMDIEASGPEGGNVQMQMQMDMKLQRTEGAKKEKEKEKEKDGEVGGDK